MNLTSVQQLAFTVVRKASARFVSKSDTGPEPYPIRRLSESVVENSKNKSSCLGRFMMLGSVLSFSLLISERASSQVTHEVYTDCRDTFTVNSPTNPGEGRSDTLLVRPGDSFKFTFKGWTAFNQNGGFGTDYCFYVIISDAGRVSVGDYLDQGLSAVNGRTPSIPQGGTYVYEAPVEDVVNPDGNRSFAFLGYHLRSYTNNATGSYFINAQLVLNTAPTLTGEPDALSVVEDVASNLDLSGAVFADEDDDNLTVTLTASAGTLAASSLGGVTIGGSGTSALTLSGSAADINTYLDTASQIQYTTPTDGSGPYTLTLSANDGTEDLETDPTIDLTVTPTPDVTNVTSTTQDGHYKSDQTIVVTVTFDMAVDVTGTPTLTLETGGVDRTATYTGGDGTNTLSFQYVVQAGDTSSDLDYASSTALDGDITGNGVAADLTLPSPGGTGSLSDNKAIVIDTTSPVVTDASLSLSGASGTGDAFKVNDTVTVTWDVSGSDGDTNITDSLGSVTVDFSAFGGGDAVAASFNGTAWVATYAIVGNASTSGSDLNVSVTATDEAGNTTTTTDTSNATVDAEPPNVSAAQIAISGATGTGGAFKIGDTVTATWNNTSSGDNNADTASVSVDFAAFGGGEVDASNASGIWSATYKIVSGTIDDINRNVTVTVLDTTGNESSQAGSDNATVDNVPPVVADGDILVSGQTGTGSVFRVDDTIQVSWTSKNSDTIDAVEVDFSAFGGETNIAATQTGDVWTAEYQLPGGSLVSNSLQLSVTAYDNAGNPTTTTKADVYAANSVQPSAVITGPIDLVYGPFAVDIVFDEAVVDDLELSDLRVDGGVVVSITRVPGSSVAFRAEIEPILGEEVVVQLEADAVVSESMGNPNAASEEFKVFAVAPLPVPIDAGWFKVMLALALLLFGVIGLAGGQAGAARRQSS